MRDGGYVGGVFAILCWMGRKGDEGRWGGAGYYGGVMVGIRRGWVVRRKITNKMKRTEDTARNGIKGTKKRREDQEDKKKERKDRVGWVRTLYSGERRSKGAKDQRAVEGVLEKVEWRSGGGGATPSKWRNHGGGNSTRRGTDTTSRKRK